MEKMKIYCKGCGIEFLPHYRTQLFCDDNCRTKFFNGKKHVPADSQKRKRHCKRCGNEFYFTNDSGGNKQHCSDKCSSESARLSRTKYGKLPSTKIKNLERERKKQIGNKERVFKRYPELPKACQSCGENRVIDIAHKPGHERKGAWRSVKNCTPDKIWILCPTCHALIDRMKYDPKTLGLC